jgi:hypothetical protein
MVAWTAAGNGIGAVTFVASPLEADITLQFGSAADAIRAVGGTPGFGVAGVTIYKREGNLPTSYITRGTKIVLDTQWFTIVYNNGGSGSLNYEQFVHHIVQHEMGHALFSNGHPWSPGTVMTAGGGSTVLTVEDINSIREAYCRP